VTFGGADIVELEMHMRKRESVMMWVDNVWRFVGTRHAVQEQEKIGSGYVGWRWRGSVFSLEGI